MAEIFCNFMSDIEEVKHQIILNCHEFWHLWSQTTHDTLFKVLYDLYSFEDSWRMQQAKGKLIKTVAKIYPIEKLTSNTILTKWETLVECDNYSVQKTAAQNLGFYVVKVLKDGNKVAKDGLLKFINKFRTSKNYKQRMLFISMTAAVIQEDTSIFTSNFADTYLKLSQDKVPNVQILLAQTLHSCSEFISKIPQLEEAEANLQDSCIPEIEALYNEAERIKQTKLPIKYD